MKLLTINTIKGQIININANHIVFVKFENNEDDSIIKIATTQGNIEIESETGEIKEMHDKIVSFMENA